MRSDTNATLVRGQKYDKLSLKIVQKALKWLLQYANFQKFSGRACSRTPLESFLLLRPSCLNLICRKKLRLKSDENWCPLPEKISEYAPDVKTFSKILFTPVFRSKRFCIWLTFKLIQKYIYPTKTLWIRFQWRTHGGGFGGQNPPPLKILKEMKTSYVGTNRVFSYRDSRNTLMFFYAIQLAYKILKNFHCDAIIGLPVVKLCWCGALNVDDCRKSETFLFCNEPTFLRAELAKTAVMFFRSVQLSNLISRNFYDHAMQQYRYFNFSDVFCLNYIFVIDAAVKQLVSRSFLKYGASAVTMAAHKSKKKSNLHCRPTRFINSL